MPGAADFTLADYNLMAQSASVGASPVAAFTVVPFDGQIQETLLVTATAITTTDSTTTVAVIPQGLVANAVNVGGTVVATVAGAGVGKVYSNTHTSNQTVQKGDSIRFTPAGGGGAGVIGTYLIRIRR